MSLLEDLKLDEINKKIIDNTIEKCSKFYNARILDAIKARWVKIYEQKLKEQKSIENVKKGKTENDKIFDTKDAEDDFEDAEVEEKDINQNVEDYISDELNDLDNISISDLSDVDPPTNDIIVALCDKMIKPCGKRTKNNNWKLKLKAGLMKIDGKEVFFNSLIGDLEF